MYVLAFGSHTEWGLGRSALNNPHIKHTPSFVILLSRASLIPAPTYDFLKNKPSDATILRNKCKNLSFGL